ncbi:NADH dehydrogenase subunit I [Chthonomonas calidirosea]|uniref:NADH-quinone oxidoreductase subunit I n=1 Tax=Chthonomonas calidirosea (strain DSM 23976 / ICMP 18418 / T49) TaxID=1303518 RepID=S0EZ22_CHTCT|nr:NADH-quinone oxidoreductase subunit NuoI [Chthonomonas calidirosea]CCW35394.1 NADH dehydrogenase subunit I [Chthonomonas calidirosea T49]CEK19425.1 NADH dehydrogenase subunit I [Chthonomonas calidirosea]CEK19426.1 NADH dehydrogenase subunit I [Chthonomonas calidirosea]CEK20405.1 NADH dehydrogenase subunit I [Chthonomonas calidirosea]
MGFLTRLNALKNQAGATVGGAKAIAIGMGITLRHYVEQQLKLKPSGTVQYPEERREQYPRTRWRHYLTRYDDGLEKCIGCSLCAGACPARCIYVEAADNTDEARYSPGERYAARYEINMLRCVFCGYCQDACPTGAIVLRKDFELADYDRLDFLYTKEMLLEPAPLAPTVPASSIRPVERELEAAKG